MLYIYITREKLTYMSILNKQSLKDSVEKNMIFFGLICAAREDITVMKRLKEYCHDNLRWRIKRYPSRFQIQISPSSAIIKAKRNWLNDAVDIMFDVRPLVTSRMRVLHDLMGQAISKSNRGVIYDIPDELGENIFRMLADKFGSYVNGLK